MTDYLIKVNNLKKTLKSKTSEFVLGEISFELCQSEITALLGLNGAGKTTLIKLILSLLKPDSGSIIFNKIIDNNRAKQISYLPESFNGINYELTVNSFLRFICNLTGIPQKAINDEVDKVLEAVELNEYKKELVSKLSKGMKTRLGIAQALIGDPLLLILDEPTDGLDPQGRKDIVKLLNRLRKNGTTILISSHILGEIEKLADNVLILHKGQLLLNGKIVNHTIVAEINNRKNIKEGESISFHRMNSLEELFFFIIGGGNKK